MTSRRQNGFGGCVLSSTRCGHEVRDACQRGVLKGVTECMWRKTVKKLSPEKMLTFFFGPDLDGLFVSY